ELVRPDRRTGCLRDIAIITDLTGNRNNFGAVAAGRNGPGEGAAARISAQLPSIWVEFRCISRSSRLGPPTWKLGVYVTIFATGAIRGRRSCWHSMAGWIPPRRFNSWLISWQADFTSLRRT